MNIVSKEVSGFLKATDLDKERLDYYESKLKSKEIIDIKFSLADTEGNLYLYEGNVRVKLANVDIKGTIYEPRYRASQLANTFAVVVTNVDREKKEVHVSHYKAKEYTKEGLMAELNAAIEKNEPLTMLARIVGIKGESYTIVDIGGVGITGVIKMQDWSTAFTSDIRLVAKRGDIIKVVVKRNIRWNGKPAYSCSRADALGFDPWEGIDKKLPKDTLVNVRCISMRDKNFFGTIDGIDEINAYCEYPDKEKNINIKIGGIYQGYVAAVNEKTKLLRVRIISALDN